MYAEKYKKYGKQPQPDTNVTKLLRVTHHKRPGLIFGNYFSVHESHSVISHIFFLR